jgi:DNA-3-methyladenine glycosylase
VTDLSQPAETVAPLLLGSELVREIDGQVLRGRIVETEAYDQTDAASHSYKGRTPRTDIMFGPAGHLYVYFTYGMHYCCNVVTGKEGEGSAVLIRALEPLSELGDYKLTDGPAKLCKAFGIDKRLNGHDLAKPPLKLILNEPLEQSLIAQTARVGISQAKDVPWRWYIKGNRWVSKAVVG